MEKVFEDYLAKKLDMLDADCSCGANYKVFVDLKEDVYGVCPKCGKRMLMVMCEKCQSGFCYPENHKVIDGVNNSWKCEVCKQVNFGLPVKSVQVFTSNEIPPEVKKEEDSRGLPKWAIWLIMGVILVIYILFN